VVASETRLELLWHLFHEKELSVAQACRLTGISPSNASLQLKMLLECGLVICRREKMQVFYRAEANGAFEFAPEVLAALQECCDRSVSFAALIRHTTAFTHERRIEIFRALRGRSLSTSALRDMTGMSSSALLRHLDKLIRRGYVTEQDRICRMGSSGNPLGRVLLELTLR
jgi:DNA-binding transcriptional ArsR family regulator